jgi:hypothetical protein
MQYSSHINQKDKINASNKFTIDMREKVLYCHQLLNHQSKKKIIKRWQPKLTLKEKNLFNEEELLSAYQNIIANTCGQHRHTQEVLFDGLKHEQDRSSVQQTVLPIHRFCRKGIYPGTSIARQQMNDNQVPWTADFPE